MCTVLLPPGVNIISVNKYMNINILVRSVINEQFTYEFELGNQSRTDAKRLQMLTSALHCTYKCVQLRHRFPFRRKVVEFINSERTSSVANSVMH